MAAGATLQLTAAVIPADYDPTYYKVVYSSANEAKATVSEPGLVTGVATVASVVITAEFKYLVGEVWTSFETPITDTVTLEVTAE